CDHNRPARVRGRDVGEHLANVPGGQFAQRLLADAVGERLEGAAVERDGLLGTAIEAVAQPVLYRLADRVAAVRRREPGGEVSVKVLELVLDLLLGASADLAADPLSARPVAERHRATPAPGAAFVGTRIAAVAGVVEVDRVVAKSTSTHRRERNTWLPH